MAFGRPTKYRPEMCDVVVEMMSEGASKAEVAAKIDVDHDTITRWQNPDGEYFIPDFYAAIKKGEALSKAWWEAHGRKQLENQKFNATLWYMNMKNRFGWRDKTEHSGDKEKPVSLFIETGENPYKNSSGGDDL